MNFKRSSYWTTTLTAADSVQKHSGIICISPGFYCKLAAINPNPYNESYGDICPVGYYCPEESYEATPCPAGTYQPHEMMTNESACLNCTPGMYCNTTGSASETGGCQMWLTSIPHV